MKKIIVVGGGFSGLIAGIFAKNKNNQVTILERNTTCGKKILVTGNGKCNYSNVDQDIRHYHTSSNGSLEKIINSKNIDKILEFYSSIGIYPKIKNGYYYPYSNQAITVQNALLRACQEKKIEIKVESFVKRIEKKEGLFLVYTETEVYTSNYIIMACGSKAYPRLGTDGSSYPILENFGHTLVPVLPALTGLKTKENMKEISGVRSDVTISLYENDTFIQKETGEIQFTDYGMSGICIMQLSHFISKGLASHKKESIHIHFIYDLYPTKEELLTFLNTKETTPIHFLLDCLLNYKITNFLLKRNHINRNTSWKELGSANQNRLINDIVNLKLEIIGTNSYEQAQVCCGGIPLTEVDLTTMESKIVDNLYIVGEVLDVDGDCGGYNITFASISGMLAGKEIHQNDSD